MQETLVWSFGQEDPLEKEMAYNYSVVFAWKIPRTEKPVGLYPVVLKRVSGKLATKQLDKSRFYLVSLVLFFLVPWKLSLYKYKFKKIYLK